MRRSIIGIVLLLSCVSACFAQRHEDTEQLGHALEYFSSGKYHEALLIFQKLDKDYKLNARFRAYIGLCYYYDWDYKNATKYLDEMIPQLGSLSPHELSVYYYANAESHFTLQEYEAAIPLFEGVLVNGLRLRTRQRRRVLSSGLLLLSTWRESRKQERHYRRHQLQEQRPR